MLRNAQIWLFLSLLSISVRAQDLRFTENRGQWEDQVLYKAETGSAVVWGEPDALTFLITENGMPLAKHPMPDTGLWRAHAYRMHFIDADGTFEGQRLYPDVANYFIGNDTLRWARNVRHYHRASTKDLYENIDLVVYGNEGRLKYDLVVRPGGNPSQVRIHYEGVEVPTIVDGKLQIVTSVGQVVEQRPFAYQLNGTQLEEIPSRFRIDGNDIVFEVDDYDGSRNLIIDPEIIFSSYIGASASNFGFTAANDPDGNLIAGSLIFQAGYPTTLGAIETNFSLVLNGNCDVGVSKFSADGSQLLYSTYLGGSGVEMAHSIVCDDDGNFIVMGTTGSPNFPTTAGAFQQNLAAGNLVNLNFFIGANHPNGCDFFISKFNGNNSGLLGSTYVGGSGQDGLNLATKLFYNYGDAFRGEVIVTEQNEIVVASCTTGGQFPMAGASPAANAPGAQDGIVFKMNSALTNLLWASYIGGNLDDAAYSVQADSNGALVVAGGTRGGSFPTTNGAYDQSANGDIDAFVMKFNQSGSAIAQSTFFGTAGYDQAYFVQLDDADNVYLIGQTDGTIPISPGVYGNANSGQFLVKFNPVLNSILWTTVIGTGSGEVDISPSAFLVSDCNQIYFSGWGGSVNVLHSDYANASTTIGLPLTPDAYQSTTDGSDFYLCMLNENAQDLVYATFFGGGVSDEHVDGGTSRFDKSGSIYQAVCAGCGGYDDFPYTPGAWSNNNGSTNCNLGVFKFDLGTITALAAIDGPTTLCEGQPAQFLNNSSGGDMYQWSFGDGSTSAAFEPVHIFESNGTFTITLSVSDSQECLDGDEVSLELTILPGVDPQIEPVDPICDGSSVQLQGFATDNFYWLDDPTLSATNVLNPTVTPTTPTTYFLVDENDCEADTTAVFVDFVVPQTDITNNTTICIGNEVQLEAEGGATYVWFPPTGLSTTLGAVTTASPEETTTYTCSIITVEGCETEEEVTVQVDFNIPGGNEYPPVPMCVGEEAYLTAEAGQNWLWYPEEYVITQGQTAVVNPPQTMTFYVDVTNACGTGTDEVVVNVITPQITAGSDGVICFGETHPVWAEGGVTYQWQPASFVLQPNNQQTVVYPPDDQWFTVYGTDETGCTASAQVFVDVLPLPWVNAGPDNYIDYLETGQLFGDAGGLPFWWEPEQGLSCVDCLTPVVTTDDAMWYVLHTIDANGCVGKDSVYVDIFFPIYVPNTFTPNNDGINELFLAVGDNIRGFRMEVHNRWGELVFATEDIHQGWDGSVRGGEHYVQIDTYVWTVWFDSKRGKEKIQGHVNVIR